MRVFATALVALALATPAAADTVTRCTGPGGGITWSNVGCGGGERAESVTVTPTVVDARGLRDWAKRSPPRRESRREERPRAARPSRLRDTVACENARRAWRFESGYSMAKRGSLGPLREEVRQACGGS
jgi:hypothetical protein